jgi:ABC-type oligopeptide transport system substrate-binding subunit
MRKKLWYTAPSSVIGVAALAAVLAVTASGSTDAKAAGQTLQLAYANSDVDYSDPALAYGSLSWEIEFETCATLITYSDVGGASTELSPAAAAGMPVISADGKTYTFTSSRASSSATARPSRRTASWPR